jgi:hypothetical protein
MCKIHNLNNPPRLLTVDAEGWCAIVQYEALLHFLLEPSLNVLALVTVQSPLNPKVAEEFHLQNISHCRCLLVRERIDLWALGEAVHGD